MKRLALVCAIVLCVPTASRAFVDTVRVSGTSFIPSAVTIHAGDSILWLEVTGFHTTTSGTGTGDPEAGILWDRPIDPTNSTYLHAFNTQGTFPYFCRFHELFGMSGTITVNAPNNLPVARDTTVATDEDQPVTGQLLAEDADGDALAFSVVQGVLHGTLTSLNTSTGAFNYMPQADFNGPDSLVFRATDGFGISNDAVVHISVAAINDPPQVVDLNVGAVINTPVSVGAMPMTDVDGGPPTFSHLTGPFHGSVSAFDAGSGAFDYDPALDFVGSDSITYQAFDGFDPSNVGVIRITVASGCDCPCHADPVCDGFTNVLDVVSAVNVAFKGAIPATDPDCPNEQTDADCSGFTNVLDVVKFVNVAFKGATPESQYCEPCVP